MKKLAMVVAVAACASGSIHAATDTFYDTLTDGRSTFDTRITNLGGTVSTKKLTGLTSGVASWVLPDFTITATDGSNRFVGQTFTGSSASDDDGNGIEMTAYTVNPPTGTHDSNGLTITFSSPINAFGIEVEDWATCCHPTALYISFDGGAAIEVGTANIWQDNPGYTDGWTTFVGAIDDAGTFTTIKFWGEANGGDILYGGNLLRWSLLPIGAIAASTQRPPLLRGSTSTVSRGAMLASNQVIQDRLNGEGLNAGDQQLTDQYLWVKPFASWADQNDQGSVVGYESKTSGLVGGADGLLSDGTRLGLALALAVIDVDSNPTASDPHSADINSYQLIAYGAKKITDDLELDFQVGIGRNSNDGKRTLTSSVAESSYDTTTALFGLGLEKTIQLDEQTFFYPSVRSDYSWAKDDGYTETGAGASNLVVNSVIAKQWIVGLKGRIENNIDDSTYLTASVGIGRELLNDGNSITSALASSPSSTYVTAGIQPDRTVKTLGLGLVKTLQDGTEVSALFDYEDRNDFTNKSVSIQARWAF